MLPFAQVAQDNFWHHPNGSPQLFTWIAIAIIAGFAMIFLLMSLPSQWRKYVTGGVTFVAGSIYIFQFFWPKPIGRQPGQLPVDLKEQVSFFLNDAVPVLGDFTNILTGLLLGLGIYSLMRIHLKKFLTFGKDWGYSAVLIGALLAQVFFGFWNYHDFKGPNAAALNEGRSWAFQNYASDLLFDGMFQQFEAAMFSIIAFYILSAAYRAFRLRSPEASILLGTALVIMLANMGAVSQPWDDAVKNVAHGNTWLLNLQLSEIKGWVSDTIQTPSLRGVDFGIGIGTIAMGLRLWLSLEKTGGQN